MWCWQIQVSTGRFRIPITSSRSCTMYCRSAPSSPSSQTGIAGFRRSRDTFSEALGLGGVGEVALLADFRRRQPGLFPDAFPWFGRHSATHRRLSGRFRRHEPDFLDRSLHLDAGLDRLLFRFRLRVHSQAKSCEQSVGSGATILEWTLSSLPRSHEFEVLPQIRWS